MRRLKLWIPTLFALLLGGCADMTWWDAQGSWSGATLVPGQTELQRTGSVSDATPGQTEQRLSLCDLRTMVVGLPFVPIERDRAAAVEVQTDQPLCVQGHTQITGGAVLIWANPASDPNGLAATRSGAWTVTGEIAVTMFTCGGTPDSCEFVPDLDVGETTNVQRIEGTLTLTATSATGEVIRIQGAPFNLTVTASRVRLSLS